MQPQVLACATQSGDCWVFSSDGGKTFRVKLKHPGACFGCDFSPRVDQQSGAELLATACEDSVIRVYDVCVPDAPVLLHTLVGHTDKVFGVLWNPILPSVLASASDDYTVRVFDINSPGGQVGFHPPNPEP
jgi:WD40 repeat protein